MTKRIISLLVILVSTSVFAAPFWGQVKTVGQSDGTTVPVMAYGDEFYHRFESLSGYTVVKNAAGMYVYADIDSAGQEFIATTVPYVPNSDPNFKALATTNAAKNNSGVYPKSVDITKEARLAIASARRALMAPPALLPAAAPGGGAPAAGAIAPPASSREAVGDIIGLTLVIEFSDVSGDIPVYHAELEEDNTVCVEDFMNMAGYDDGNNNGSVNDYYSGVSNAKLNYTNIITGYYTAPESYSFYDNDGSGNAYHDLIQTALEELGSDPNSDGGFDASLLTLDENNTVLALNVLYAGPFGSNMLWPHMWYLSATGHNPSLDLDEDGTPDIFFDIYQTSNIGTLEAPEMLIGTTCHENGHMLCGYADLYDYGYDSSGVGYYCLMATGSWGGDGYNPSAINGYYRWTAGWETMQILTNADEGIEHTAFGSMMQATQAGGAAEDWDNFQQYQGNVFAFVNEDDSKEFFVIENTPSRGRSMAKPDNGLAIWHVDQNVVDAVGLGGANDAQDMLPDAHYYVSLEQADGDWDLERYFNDGDSTDLFGDPDYPIFNASMGYQPNSYWWDGTLSKLRVYGISAPDDDEMTFYVSMLPPYARVVYPSGSLPNDPTKPGIEVGRFLSIQAAIDALDDPTSPVYNYYDTLGNIVGPRMDVNGGAIDPTATFDIYVGDENDYAENLNPNGRTLNIYAEAVDPFLFSTYIDPNDPAQGMTMAIDTQHFLYEDWAAYTGYDETSGLDETTALFTPDRVDADGVYEYKNVPVDTTQVVYSPLTMEARGPLLTVEQGESLYIEDLDFALAAYKAVSIAGGSNVEFVDSEFHDNGLSDSATYVSYRDNTTAIQIDGTSSLTARGCSFTGNYAHAVGGAAVYAGPLASAYIYDCDFTANESLFDGGAVYGTGSYLEIDGCIFADNFAKYFGGAVALQAVDGNTIVRDSQFTGNMANVYGGAVYLDSDAIRLVNNLYAENYSAWYGGALFVQSPGPAFEISSSTFDKNYALIDGDGVYLTDGSAGGVNMWNNIFSNHYGYAVFEESAGINVSLQNNDFFANGADYFDEGIIGYIGANELNNFGSGNIDTDPMYVPGYLGNYYLSNAGAGQVLDVDGNIAEEVGTSSTSPCVDAGNGSGASYEVDVLSNRTDNMPDDGAVDIGFHYTDDNGIYTGIFTVTINGNPIEATKGAANWTDNGGTYTYSDPNLVNIKPYQQVIIDIANCNAGYAISNWYDELGELMTEITGNNDPNSDYIALYDEDGQRMYVGSEISGVPYRIVLTIDRDRILSAEFEKKLVQLLIYVSTQNGQIWQEGLLKPIGEYVRGQVVDLSAKPFDTNMRVQWTGSDNDASMSLTNQVTMREDYNEVSVRFYQPNIWTVGPQNDNMSDSLEITMMQEGFKDGDIIQLQTGEYNLLGTSITRPCTIESATGNPEDVVIKSDFTFYGVGRNTIFRGITLDGIGELRQIDSSASRANGGTTINPTVFGDHGISGYGDLMRIYDASPTIVNCIIRDGGVQAENGYNSASPTTPPHSGHGGWPGSVMGGAVEISSFSEPLFVNCTFEGNQAVGGHGGNALQNGIGGLWYEPIMYTAEYYELTGIQAPARISNLVMSFLDPAWDYNGYYTSLESKERYAGRGGAVYIGIAARPEFYGCTFTGNSVQSGSSGTASPAGPSEHWRIPSYGGAVFCDARSEPVFEDCYFADNIANYAIPTTHPDGGMIENSTAYYSYGGALYADRNSLPVMRRCEFVNNEAEMGGAVYVDNIGAVDEIGDEIRQFIIEDCTFTSNISSVGGAVVSSGGRDSQDLTPEEFALYGVEDPYDESVYLTGPSAQQTDPVTGYSWGPIAGEKLAHSAGFTAFIRDRFIANSAILYWIDEDYITDADDNRVAPSDYEDAHRTGLGGAIALYSSRNEIVDSVFDGNISGGFGGAVAITGKTPASVFLGDEYESSYIRNCLFTGNYSAFGGGAFFASSYTDPQFVNCTIADNAVTNATGKGGGILATRNSYISIINSILYGNLCSNGSQVAADQVYEGEPSEIYVNHSLIEPANNDVIPLDMGIDAVRPVRDPAVSSVSFSDLEVVLNKSTDRVYYDADYADLYGADFTAYGNDFSSDLVELGFTINFYGETTNTVFISENGCISFWRPIDVVNEELLTTDIDTPVIAAFHGDVDSRRAGAPTSARGTAWVMTEDGEYILTNVFAVTWKDVGYYSEQQNLLNTFQLVLIDRSDRGENDFDIEFDYDKIQWDTWQTLDGTGLVIDEQTGETDGTGEVNGSSWAAVAGFSEGTGVPGTFYELEGSGQEGSFIDDSSTALIARARNSEAMGRLVFRVIEGMPQIRFGSPVYVSEDGIINYDAETETWDAASGSFSGDPVWAQEGVYYLNKASIAVDETLADSPCFNAGAGNARDYNIYRHTTTIDNELDVDTVDLGYHYLLPITKGLEGDFNFDGTISVDELLATAEYWLDECSAPYWCHGRDLNEDGVVNLVDTTVMAPVGTIDVVPPQPLFGESGDPIAQDFTETVPRRMTWEVAPISNGSGVGSIRMVASLTTDNCIGAVEYIFEQTYPTLQTVRDWNTDREFIHDGLVVGQAYSYRCKGRDVYGNETAWSLAVRTIAGDDSEAPVTDLTASNPYKSQWELRPHVVNLVGNTADIKMVAVEATDLNEVEYYFECTSGNGHDSGWIDTNEYIDEGVATDALYTYRVRTRDLSRNFNLGDWSDEASAYADAANIIDTEPPAPISYISAAGTQTAPYLIWQNYVFHYVTAVTDSVDISLPVWYQFICETNSSLSSPKLIETGVGIIIFDEDWNQVTDPGIYEKALEKMKGEATWADGTVTWTVPIGPTGTTSRWKVICGDAEGNYYELSEQPQSVVIRASGVELNLDSVDRLDLVTGIDGGDAAADTGADTGTVMGTGTTIAG
jgi:M6 family metalloprotease-like protein